VETLRALDDALASEFAGWVAVISHDAGSSTVSPPILACEGDPKWVFFNGNYQEYEADKRKRLGVVKARSLSGFGISRLVVKSVLFRLSGETK